MCRRSKGVSYPCPRPSALLRTSSLYFAVMTPKKQTLHIAIEKKDPASLPHRRFPGTKMKRQQTAVVKTRNMTMTVSERLISVFLTNSSLILLKSKNVYSLYPRKAMIGSSMYWCVKMR
jgi:hypothetical protein